MKRRIVILGSGGFSAFVAIRARAKNVPPDVPQSDIDVIAPRLKALGYFAGRDILIDTCFADHNVERLPALARELVALRPSASRGFLQRHRDGPHSGNTQHPHRDGRCNQASRNRIVRESCSAWRQRHMRSYNKPEIGGKLVEVLKAAAPRVSRVALIWNPDVPRSRRGDRRVMHRL